MDNYTRSSYIESGRYKISIEPEGGMYLVAVLIWGVITAAGIWLGESKGLKAFLFPFRIEQFFAKLTNPFQDRVDIAKSLFGVIPADVTLDEARKERLDRI